MSARIRKFHLKMLTARKSSAFCISVDSGQGGPCPNINQLEKQCASVEHIIGQKVGKCFMP